MAGDRLAGFLSVGILSQHPQRSSWAGGAACSAPGVAAHYPHTKKLASIPCRGVRPRSSTPSTCTRTLRVGVVHSQETVDGAVLSQQPCLRAGRRSAHNTILIVARHRSIGDTEMPWPHAKAGGYGL